MPASFDTSSSLPRRTSLRLAQASSISNSGKAGPNSEQSNAAEPRAGHSSKSIEVAIPLKKVGLRSNASSPTLTEDSSGDAVNEYNTPATSVAVTPVESDTNKPRKRISASTRARELRSSTFSLNNSRRGLKRDSAAISANTNTESSDEALARALQMEEYQNPPKRHKPSTDTNSYSLEIQDSTDDGSTLTDLGEISETIEEGPRQWQPRPRTRSSFQMTGKTVILNSEESNSSERDEIEDEMEDIYQLDLDSPLSDSESPTSEDDDDEPLTSRPQRNRNNSRTQTRVSASRSSRTNRALPPGMSYRVSWKVFLSH